MKIEKLTLFALFTIVQIFLGMGSYDVSQYHQDALRKLADPSLFISDAFIDGQWIKGDRYFDVIEPSTETVLGKVISCDTRHFQAAIASANKAQPKYFASTTAHNRSTLLKKWAESITHHKKDSES